MELSNEDPSRPTRTASRHLPLRRSRRPVGPAARGGIRVVVPGSYAQPWAGVAAGDERGIKDRAAPDATTHARLCRLRRNASTLAARGHRAPGTATYRRAAKLRCPRRLGPAGYLGVAAVDRGPSRRCASRPAPTRSPLSSRRRRTSSPRPTPTATCPATSPTTTPETTGYRDPSGNRLLRRHWQGRAGSLAATSYTCWPYPELGELAALRPPSSCDGGASSRPQLTVGSATAPTKHAHRSGNREVGATVGRVGPTSPSRSASVASCGRARRGCRAGDTLPG